MSKPKHTPRPWEVHQSAVEYDQFAITGKDACVAMFRKQASLDYSVFEKNVRLIAAAPDLLAVVERINPHLIAQPGLLGDLCDDAEKAIKKAKGES